MFAQFNEFVTDDDDQRAWSSGGAADNWGGFTEPPPAPQLDKTTLQYNDDALPAPPGKSSP